MSLKFVNIYRCLEKEHSATRIGFLFVFASTDEGEVARINKGYWNAFKKPIRNRLFIEVLDHDVVSFCVYFFCS